MMIRITALVLSLTAIMMLLQFTIGDVIGVFHVFNQTCVCNPQLEEINDRAVADDPKINERVNSTVSGEEFLAEGDKSNEELLNCDNVENKTGSDHEILSSLSDKSAIYKGNISTSVTVSQDNSEGNANCDVLSDIHRASKRSDIIKSIDSEIRSKEWAKVKRRYDNNTYKGNAVATFSALTDQFAVSDKEDTESNNSEVSEVVSNATNTSEEESETIKESDDSGNGNVVSRQDQNLETHNNDNESLSLLNNESCLSNNEVQLKETVRSKSQDNVAAINGSTGTDDHAKETVSSEIKNQSCEKVLKSNNNLNASNTNEKKVQNLTLRNNSEVFMEYSESSDEDNDNKSDINKEVKIHDICVKESANSEITDNNTHFISNNEFQKAQNGSKNFTPKWLLPDNQITHNKNVYIVDSELNDNNSHHSDLDGNNTIKNVKSDKKKYEDINYLKISGNSKREETSLRNSSNYASENKYTKDVKRNARNNSMHIDSTKLSTIEGVFLATANRNSSDEQITNTQDGDHITEKYEIMFPPDCKCVRSIDALLRQTDYYDPSYTIIKVVKRSSSTLTKNYSATALPKLVDQENRNVSGDGESRDLKLLRSTKQRFNLLQRNVGNWGMWQNDPDTNESEISNIEKGENGGISRQDNEEIEQQDEVQLEGSHNRLTDTMAAVHDLLHGSNSVNNAFNSYPDSDISIQDLPTGKNTANKNNSTSMEDETNFEVADDIVLSILDAAHKDGHMRRELGICRKITSKGIPLALQKKGKEQIIVNKTNEILQEIRSCTAALIRKQVEEQACIILPPELQNFLEWLLGTGGVPCTKPDKVATNFLFNDLEQDRNMSIATTCAATAITTCPPPSTVMITTSAATTLNKKTILTGSPCVTHVSHRNTTDQVKQETCQGMADTAGQKKASCCSCTKSLESPMSTAGLAQYMINGPVSKEGIWSSNPQPYLMIPNAPAKPVLYLMEKPKPYLPQGVFINGGKKRRESQKENKSNCSASMDMK